jgi:DNA-directed RNA polymerase subunit K/omega
LNNSFEFVVTAGARARQLLAGCTPRIDGGGHKKVTIAQQETIAGVVEKVKVEKGKSGAEDVAPSIEP